MLSTTVNSESAYLLTEAPEWSGGFKCAVKLPAIARAE